MTTIGEDTNPKYSPVVQSIPYIFAILRMSIVSISPYGGLKSTKGSQFSVSSYGVSGSSSAAELKAFATFLMSNISISPDFSSGE